MNRRVRITEQFSVAAKWPDLKHELDFLRRCEQAKPPIDRSVLRRLVCQSGGELLEIYEHPKIGEEA